MNTTIKSIFISLFLVLGLSASAFSQNITVKGKVTDQATGKGISNVVVTVKGAKQPISITNKTGDYSITTQKGKTLVFGHSGYIPSEIVVKQSEHNVKLLKFTPPIIVDAEEIMDDAMSLSISEVHYDKSMVKEELRSGQHNKMFIQGIFATGDGYQSQEEYTSFKENRFLSAKNEPLSTFSLDVDAASYSNVRRVINQGQLPQKDAIRVEEMINYFSYDYAQPKGEHPVNIVTETSICPWNEKHGLVRIGVKAKEIPSDKLPASNFVFLIDVSGSMYGPTRLDLVKSSLKLLTNNLREKDRVAIVVYAGAAGEVLPSTAGTDKQKILEALESLTAGGSTAGGAGIQLAYKIAKKNFIKDGNNRIILCTDGDFNVGISSNSELENLIESKRKTGIFLTVLGYGMGNYKDSKLQILAQKGNGNHAYIDNIQEANKVLVNEFGSTMYTVAKDVKIQVEFNPAYINAYRLVGYESRLLNKEDFNDDTKDAGELGSGHTVTALYEIIPVGVENSFGGVDPLKYQDNKTTQESKTNKYSTELMTVKLRYKKPTEDNSLKMEVPVTASQLSKQASPDFKFAMAVAMFGQLLRDSDFKADGTYQKVISLAKEGIGEDTHGYRKEFIRLAKSVNRLTK